MNIERVNKSLTEIEMQDIRNTVEYVHLKIQKMYPIGYFSHSKGKLYLKEAMKHYAYNIKGLTEDELIQQFSQSLIKEAGLINGIKKAYNHKLTFQYMTEQFKSYFDITIFERFTRFGDEFEKIYDES